MNCVNRDNFSIFKNIHSENSGIIFGTGPSLLDYDNGTGLHNESIRVGVNSIIYHDVDLKLDYFFIQDTGISEKHTNSYLMSKSEYDTFKTMKQKFYGVSGGNRREKWYLTPRDCVDGDALSYQINTTTKYAYTSKIDTEPLGEGHTVVMSAIQFLLFTGITEIYLVGIDCIGARIKETKVKKYNLKGWIKMKEWVSKMPSVNINIVNPVGLKGMFNDVYIDA